MIGINSHSGTACCRRVALRTQRRGSLLVEMVVCTVLLSIVAAILVPGIHAVNDQRKATRFDTMALIELNNQAALLKQRGKMEGSTLSAWFQQRYPDAELGSQILPEEGTPEGFVAVRFSITRPSTEPQSIVSRSLVVWMSQAEGRE